MKKFWAICLLVVALVPNTTSVAAASAINHNFELGGFRVSYGYGSSEDSENDSVWGNVFLSTNVHRIDSVFVDFFHPSYESDDVWIWVVGLRGTKNAEVNNESGQSVASISVGGVSFYQGVGYGYQDYDGSNYAFASLGVSPSVIDRSNFWYYEYYDEMYQVTRFYMNIDLHGSFGPGELGDELGRAYFGTPEPNSLALLGGGLIFFLRLTSRRLKK